MPIKDGCSWIQSFTGKRINLLSPDPDVICIEDIARALSQICRYTGHSSEFYSVAEHSVHVSYRARYSAWEWREVLQDNTIDVDDAARWGLLHDASEAYLGDVSRPLKYLSGMEAYRALEKEWTKAIAQRFGLKGEEPDVVAKADEALLFIEARSLLAPMHPDWPGKDCLVFPLASEERLGMNPDRAEKFFLSRFAELFP